MLNIIQGERRSGKTTKLLSNAITYQNSFSHVYFITILYHQKENLKLYFTNENKVKVVNMTESISAAFIMESDSLICIDDFHLWPRHLAIKILDKLLQDNTLKLTYTEDGSLSDILN